MLWNWLLFLLVFSFGMMAAPPTRQTDEDAIRRMVAEAIRRLNQGDLTAIRDFWDENSDYVGIGGEFIHGRQAMESFLARLVKAGAGQETAAIEQVRFVTPDLAIVDGSWTRRNTAVGASSLRAKWPSIILSMRPRLLPASTGAVLLN